MIGDKDIETPFEKQIARMGDGSTEKNGLRFPSRIWIQEAYVRERGRAFVRSETDVKYKAFKFFTVETEVRRDRLGAASSGR